MLNLNAIICGNKFKYMATKDGDEVILFMFRHV